MARIQCPECGHDFALPKPENRVRGERHYAWKGDGALPHTKRERAKNAYSLEGVVCQYEGCERPAKDRHHKDDDPGNNAPENIDFLCRKHHMLIDGRLAVFAGSAQPFVAVPPRECIRCGVLSKPTRHGRCNACASYIRRNGIERPERLLVTSYRERGTRQPA